MELKEWITSEAKNLGFIAVGVSKADSLDREAKQLELWLNQKHQGSMQWMENHFDLRRDPQRLVPGAKSIISLAYNYFTEDEQKDPEAPIVSMYALGKDYHTILRKKLKELLHRIREQVGQVEGRCFVDSGPVMERVWAERGGIGWNGKNTLTIHPKRGSYFFLAELILDLELPPDAPIADHCGTCTRCIEACPTQAIHPNGYLLDASRCISYLTIELKEDTIPEEFQPVLSNYVFGCDICQQVCPWNKFSTPHQEPTFAAQPEILNMSKKDWEEITEEVFQQIAKDSPLKRTGFQGIKRNLKALFQKNT